ncbi:hypothetical protein [Lysinibacillus cavernae]|uniref:hypothetical protein n=1 Tax=Lysinibacillus cavernae TaxID=2666135 RepID=UPI0012D985A2|nr:hypothetical protein [Lysinibacillus cavernae]
MEKIHLANIIKSFFLGLFIGVILLLYGNEDVIFSYKVSMVLASGSIGFLIGFISEWLTTKLPISIANARTYFLINNLIALIVTTLIMASLMMTTSSEMLNKGEFTTTLCIVLGIICMANLFDYLMYRRTQNKLKKFKSMIQDNKL